MADVNVSKSEGKEDSIPIPMYSIQSEIPVGIIIPQTAGHYIPYTVPVVTNLNPCAEGLEDPVLIPSVDEKNEGKNENAAAVGGARRKPPKPRDDSPSCCRRYSCCFPLIIVTVIWLMMFSAQEFEHCQDCLSLS